MADVIVERIGVRNPQVLELAGGRLHALGAELPVGDRASWVAPGVSGHQRQNTYMLVDGGAALLVDCGPAVLEGVILEQLRALLAPGRRLTIVLTRSEFETTGNLAAIVAAFPVAAIHATGGTSNPFDGFQLAADGASSSGADRRGLEAVGLSRVRPGTTLAWGDGRALEALRAPLRMLACGWFFDAATGTLFASDGFGFAVDDAEVTVEQAYNNLVARYWWLPGARTAGIVAALDAVFAERDVERIAPTHGPVVEGRDAVARAVATLRGALERA